MKKATGFLLKSVIFLVVFVNIITAFHAYKFTHFYNRDEVVMKKNEDKTGWDKAREILFGINAVKQLNTVSADTGFEKIVLTTKDKLKLNGWMLKTDSTAKGTVALFHGHGSTKSGVIAESAAFRKMGYNTLLIDFRAHGNSEGNVSTIGYDEAEDVKLVYDFIKSRGEKNIILWGISMGAATITKAINDYDLKPAKVILEMPFGSILDAAQGRIKMMHLPPEPLATLVTFWGGVEHGFWAFDMKPVSFVKKIGCPVLLQWGKNDPRVTKNEIDQIYNNIKIPEKLVVYENSGHESLCKKEYSKWYNEVSVFLN